MKAKMNIEAEPLPQGVERSAQERVYIQQWQIQIQDKKIYSNKY